MLAGQSARVWHEDGDRTGVVPEKKTARKKRQPETTAFSEVSVRSVRSERGFSFVDLVVVLVIIGVMMGVMAPLSRRIIASYQLNSATQTLIADLSQAKIRAIQSNSIVPVSRQSPRRYQLPGVTRELPVFVHFKPESVPSIAYNGLGTLTQPSEGVRKFVLTNVYGQSREIRMYPGGGYELRKRP